MAGTAAAWRCWGHGAVTASLQETSDLATVSEGALAGPGTTLGPGDGSQRAVLALLGQTERGVAVRHGAEPGVGAAVAGGGGGEVTVRTEAGAVTFLPGAGEAQTVQTQPGVGTAGAGGCGGQRAVPAVVKSAVSCSPAVPGTEEGAGTTPARGGGRH